MPADCGHLFTLQPLPEVPVEAEGLDGTARLTGHHEQGSKRVDRLVYGCNRGGVYRVEDRETREAVTARERFGGHQRAQAASSHPEQHDVPHVFATYVLRKSAQVRKKCDRVGRAASPTQALRDGVPRGGIPGPQRRIPARQAHGEPLLVQCGQGCRESGDHVGRFPDSHPQALPHLRPSQRQPGKEGIERVHELLGALGQ